MVCLAERASLQQTMKPFESLCICNVQMDAAELGDRLPEVKQVFPKCK